MKFCLNIVSESISKYSSNRGILYPYSSNKSDNTDENKKVIKEEEKKGTTLIITTIFK